MPELLRKTEKTRVFIFSETIFLYFHFNWVDLWGVSKIVVPQFLFKLLQSSQVQKSTGVTCDPLFIRTVAAVSCAAFSLWHHQKETGRDWTFSTARLTKKYFSSHFSCQPQQNLQYFPQLLKKKKKWSADDKGLKQWNLRCLSTRILASTNIQGANFRTDKSWTECTLGTCESGLITR